MALLNQEETMLVEKNARRVAIVLNNTDNESHEFVVQDDEGNTWECSFELNERADEKETDE